jgi:hypothetical protein
LDVTGDRDTLLADQVNDLSRLSQAYPEDAMSDNKNDNVVVALFANRAAAEAARQQLQTWDKADDSVKLGHMGIITNEDGTVKTSVPRNWGKGMVVGAVAALLTPIALVGGVLAGGAAGSFFKKDLNLTKEEAQMIGDHLDEGGAALIVTLDDAEIQPATDQLVSYGGKVRTYIVPTADLQAVHEAAQAEAAVEQVEEEPPAPAANAPTSEQPVA